jgi:hypothetical protein
MPIIEGIAAEARIDRLVRDLAGKSVVDDEIEGKCDDECPEDISRQQEQRAAPVCCR